MAGRPVGHLTERHTVSTIPIEEPGHVLALPPIVAYWLGIRQGSPSRRTPTLDFWAAGRARHSVNRLADADHGAGTGGRAAAFTAPDR